MHPWKHSLIWPCPQLLQHHDIFQLLSWRNPSFIIWRPSDKLRGRYSGIRLLNTSMYHTKEQTQDRWEGSAGYSANPDRGCWYKELPSYLSLIDCYMVAMERWLPFLLFAVTTALLTALKLLPQFGNLLERSSGEVRTSYQMGNCSNLHI